MRAVRCISMVLLSLGLGWAGAQAGPPVTDHAVEARLAQKFSSQFLKGKHDRNLPLMTDEMQAASGAETSEQVRLALTARYGAVTGLGEAWLEDKFQGYLRFRVPVEFEKDSIDFRVVIDNSSKIAGFFIMPRLDRPEKRPVAGASGD